MRRKKTEEQRPAATGGSTRIQPLEVQQVEFRLAFRGYNERDVDAFLDRVTEDLVAYIEENQRLRSASGAAPLAAGAEARSQAEEIVTRAREEAAAIVRDAELRAAATGAPTGVPRAVVAPFLNKEREFLQALGGLVQGHAEDVKEMVLALRPRPDAEITATSRPALAEAAGAAAPTPGLQAPAEGSEETALAGAAEEETGSEGPGMPEDVAAPIRVPESEDASAKAETGTREAPAPAPATPSLRRDPGERSLRELFWGED